MNLTLLGTIQTTINGSLYEIIQDGEFCVYNEDKRHQFETLPKAISYLRGVKNDLILQERIQKTKNDTLNVKKMQLNEIRHFDINQVKLLRPLLIYYRKKYNRDFINSFEYIDGIRKFKVTRIK